METRNLLIRKALKDKARYLAQLEAQAKLNWQGRTNLKFQKQDIMLEAQIVSVRSDCVNLFKLIHGNGSENLKGERRSQTLLVATS